MVENIDSLLLLLVGKSKQKRDKVFQCYQSIDYNPETREYKSRSVSKPDKWWTIKYHKAKRQWFCDCPAVVYQKYKRFEDLEKRNKDYRKNKCIHTLACILYNMVNK